MIYSRGEAAMVEFTGVLTVTMVIEPWATGERDHFRPCPRVNRIQP